MHTSTYQKQNFHKTKCPCCLQHIDLPFPFLFHPTFLIKKFWLQPHKLISHHPALIGLKTLFWTAQRTISENKICGAAN